MLIEVMAICYIISSAANIVAFDRIKKENKRLLKQNQVFGEHLLTENKSLSSTENHDWEGPFTDVLYTSKIPWSYERVVCHIWICKKCRITHKVIVSGLTLAKKKNISVEGFYLGGSQIVQDPGCSTRETGERYVDVE